MILGGRMIPTTRITKMSIPSMESGALFPPTSKEVCTPKQNLFSARGLKSSLRGNGNIWFMSTPHKLTTSVMAQEISIFICGKHKELGQEWRFVILVVLIFLQIHNHLVEEAFLNPPDSHEHKCKTSSPSSRDCSKNSTYCCGRVQSRTDHWTAKKCPGKVVTLHREGDPQYST